MAPTGEVQIWSHERWGYGFGDKQTTRMVGYMDHTGPRSAKTTI